MILDNKHFVLTMSISITAVTLILTLNVIGIFEEKLDIKNQLINKKGLTGLVIENENQENQQNNNQEKEKFFKKEKSKNCQNKKTKRISLGRHPSQTIQ